MSVLNFKIGKVQLKMAKKNNTKKDNACTEEELEVLKSKQIDLNKFILYATRRSIYYSNEILFVPDKKLKQRLKTAYMANKYAYNVMSTILNDDFNKYDRIPVDYYITAYEFLEESCIKGKYEKVDPRYVKIFEYMKDPNIPMDPIIFGLITSQGIFKTKNEYAYEMNVSKKFHLLPSNIISNDDFIILDRIGEIPVKLSNSELEGIDILKFSKRQGMATYALQLGKYVGYR